MKAIRLYALGFALGSIIISTAANAGVITSGTVYNNTGGVHSANFTVDNLHNQDGLSSNYVDGITDFATYTGSGVTHATVESAGGTWLSAAGIPQFPIFLDFDLGIAKSVLSMALWNGTAGNTADVKGFSVFISSVANFAISTLVGTFTNPIGVAGPEPVNVFNLLDTTGRYVRLQLNSYYGNTCCTGIGEVAFDVGPAAQVPEPATLALLALGLVGVGARRRQIH